MKIKGVCKDNEDKDVDIRIAKTQRWGRRETGSGQYVMYNQQQQPGVQEKVNSRILIQDILVVGSIPELNILIPVSCSY